MVAVRIMVVVIMAIMMVFMMVNETNVIMVVAIMVSLREMAINTIASPYSEFAVVMIASADFNHS